MMKKLLLASGFCLLTAPAWAACAVTNLTVKDAAASPVTALVPYADDGSGGSNCSPQIQIKQGGNVAVVTAAGAQKTDSSATTQPVSGTVTANQGTGWGFAAGSTTSGQAGSLTMGAVTTSAPSYTTGQTNFISLDPSGNTRVLSSINQGTFGTTNGVVNAANTYQAVAASQTATVLQTSTGATGDYLSHCIIYPTSTSPGVVTVFDSTNTAANSAVLFAGGASSTSNLTPITVPVGAKSVNGAWKVTTGASVSVVCVGHFS